ncbi:Glyoxylase, beta-lactamase superfamily II [Paucidesulfovibrio gracilis DSM 16080]|uniref:Glyoxylase, beta-lactamase superfamily II n=1 Tax=Paucidesulfovibrio gracilis DSM 16080 TaxID=1121449 RepID=A0A1T4W9M4_9BACT|nr:MBL fold metallo-hydrolase [Paucidesulfovibrio gracilis]SKA73675.1 Glyoxylase, beta-lactamase superfamily II [Paucidesulfovibrio gracilis DSM 16080]
MNVITLVLGPLGTNTYLCSHNGEAVVIDPGGDPAPILDKLRKKNLTLTHILVTHLHFDHIYGCKALAEATGAPVLAPQADEHLLQTEVGQGGIMGLPKVELFDFQALEPGRHTFLGQECQALHTPGHTPGSLTFYFPDAGLAFVGDLIFRRAVGRTDFPGGNADTLAQSVRENIFTLPDATILYPGHMEQTTVGEEENHNPFFTGL